MGGGKGGGTSTTNNISKTEIPPEVLARYNAVNARAETVAQQPYQKYSNDPNAFVAGLTPTQQAGIQNTNLMAGAAQPFYGAAANLASAGTGNVNPEALNVQQFYNPYTEAVAKPTLQALQQQQAVERSNLINPQTVNAFGGDRGGVVAANLARQQALGTAQVMNPIYKQAYDQALAAAQQQQGVGLGAAQANRQNFQQAAQLFGNLGTGAQQAGLAGAQAQLQAGQAQQQTEQAGKQAMYNQFMQEQGYPFQVAQFLANVATGTGALSGNTTAGTSTTTTQGGGGFFSDERLKENIKKVGETNDGQPIYRYNYKGDPRTQIGLLAQDVEKHHPEAVGLAGGYKTVDYKKATQDAVHKATGGEMTGNPSGTGAYDIDAPSAMLGKPMVGPEAVASMALPMGLAGGRGEIPVRSMTPASEIEALRAPKATGLSPGTIEGARAQRASLGSALEGGDEEKLKMGSGRGYVQSEYDRLGKFLEPYNSQYSSQGGLVGHEGGAFARGGYAFGGGPYGVQLTPMQYQMLHGTPMTSAPPPPKQEDALKKASEATSTGLGMAKLYDWYNKPSAEKSGYDNEWTPGEDNSDAIIDLETPVAARGGLIGGRQGFYGNGYVNPQSYISGVLQEQSEAPSPRKLANSAADFAKPQKPQEGGGLGSLVDAGLKARNLYKGGEWAAGKLGLGAPETAMSATSTGAIPEAIDLTSGAGLAAGVPEAAAVAAPEALAGAGAAAEGLGLMGTLGSIGEGIVAALPFLGFLSDERAKHDIKKVGTLFDGQPVYRYSYNGDDRTQMGLLAQKVEKARPEAVGLAGGMKMVDYEKATDKAAKRGHYQSAGGVPVVVPDEYSTAEPEFATVRAPETPVEPPVRGARAVAPAPGLGAAPPPRPVQVGDNELTVVPRATIPDTTGNAMPAPRPTKPVERRTPAPEPAFPSLGGLVPEGARETLSSQNFWVPALTGIGAMLASPNKTLAGAIGSGLVAGTGAYTGLEKQQSEIAKNSLDVFNKIFEKREDGEGNISYMNLQTGKPATPQEAFNFLKKMPGFAGLGTAPAVATSAAPQRDATVALASDVVDKGVEPVAPRIPSTPATSGVPKVPAPVPAETTRVTPSAPAVPNAPPTPSATAKPEDGEQAAIRIPEAAQAAILKADAWARAQPDVKKHLAEAELQSRIADQRQAQMRGPLTPEKRTTLAKEFEIANAQAREAASRAEAAVTRLTAPILTDISKQLGVTPEAVAGAARMEAGKARAVLAPDIVTSQAEAAGAKARAEAEAKARVEEATFVRTDPTTGVKYRLPLDKATNKPIVEPPAEPPMNGAPAPKKAEIEPNTRAVIPGRPKPPKGGGMPLAAILPANFEVVGDLDHASTELIKKDAEFYSDLLNKSESLTVGSQRYNTITNAFKLFQSGPGAEPLSEYAAIAKSWGQPELAEKIFDGKPEAVAILKKQAPGLVLEQLKAATPRFAQSEFTALLDKAVPDAGRLPEANFQIVAEGLAIMNRSNAFLDSWADAQADGWRSMSAYYREWSKANPLAAYLESAKLQMGNFAGMPIPPEDKLAVGATYVTPKELDQKTKTAFGALGIQPGDIWRYNGRGKNPTVIPKADMFSVYMGY